MNPADKRLTELLDKWLASLELHLKYSTLDEASYWKVQPWVKHDRPSRWIIELAKQKALQLKEQIDSRATMGDTKFGDALELMAFLTNLVGSQHIERFIPLAEAQSEIDPRAVSQTQEMPHVARAEESTRESALVTQPRETIRARTDVTREMPRPEPVEPLPPPPPPAARPAPPPPPAARPAPKDSGRHAHPRADSRKGARRDGKHAHGAGARARTSPEKEKTVVADAIRLLGWGREWHELPDLIGRMADRPPGAEIRRILRDHKAAIEKQLKS
ncbi:MAG TPA: hypothetical protein VJ764_08090 [Steroidobacteraceae bacterium]|nr:hypothetical protein [Steroidobacteraceae bacterium]